MDYTDFSTDDFVSDPFFIRWVYDPDEETNRFWAAWLDKYPRKKDVVEEARIILMLKAGMEMLHPPGSRIRKMKSVIDQQIRDRGKLKVISKKRRIPERPGSGKGMRRQWVYAVAAVLAGILIAGTVYLFMERQALPVGYHTGYGVTKAVTLPDGSKAILNANSRLSYRKGWKEGQPREIWIDGEAFFKVKEQYSSGEKVKFIVHNDDLDVEVLGTAFSVSKRGGKTRVVLSSGKVRLNIPGNGDTSSVMMQPGELVEYSKQDANLARKKVDAGDYISWIDNELVFRSTPLEEIIEILEHDHGVTVILLDHDLARRKITTTLPADDLEFILEALSETLSADINKREDRIYTIKKTE